MLSAAAMRCCETIKRKEEEPAEHGTTQFGNPCRARGHPQPNRLVLLSPATMKRRVASLPACSGPAAAAPSSEAPWASEEGRSPELAPPVGSWGHSTRSSASTPGRPEADGDADAPVLPVLLLPTCKDQELPFSQGCLITARFTLEAMHICNCCQQHHMLGMVVAMLWFTSALVLVALSHDNCTRVHCGRACTCWVNTCSRGGRSLWRNHPALNGSRCLSLTVHKAEHLANMLRESCTMRGTRAQMHMTATAGTIARLAMSPLTYRQELGNMPSIKPDDRMDSRAT